MLHISNMTPSDLDEVAAIAAPSFTPPWSREAFLDEMARAVSRCVVLRTEVGGPVRAYAIWWIIADEQSLLTIATDPSERRRGAARALIAEMIADGVRCGVTECFLEVRPSNEAAVALYQAHGFELLDVRRAYYDDREDAWIMVRRFA